MPATLATPGVRSRTGRARGMRLARARCICRVALAVWIALAIAHGRDARACANAAYLATEERVKTLHAAEAALDEGDVTTARELAAEVQRQGVSAGPDVESVESAFLHDRASRIAALAVVRDPGASSAQLARAALALGSLRAQRAVPDPALDADHAEALARTAGGRDEAYATLRPLAERDLLGSAGALGALHRLAAERGDVRTATLARSRCEAMVGARSICRGEYPRAPLIRGGTRTYLPPALMALVVLAFRLLRARRLDRLGRDAAGRPLSAPWVGHAAALQALAALGAAFYVFARPSSPVLTSMTFALVLLLSLVLERRGFFAWVRRGRAPGLVLRAAIADDAHLREVALFGGPTRPETLESDEGSSGYRDPARRPLLRLVRRRLPLGLSFVAAVAVALLVMTALFVLLGAFLSLRGG